MSPLFKALALAAVLLSTGCTLASGDPLEEPILAADAQVTLLQTTDLHHAADGVGHVEAGVPGSPGTYARIAAYVEQVRSSAGHPVLLVDSGDWSMGTCYDLTLGQQPLALLFMDALRYDCATLGNHEFDYGPAGLARILGSAERSFGFATPLVASNTVLNGQADLAPWLGPGRRIPPSRVQTLANGLRVGYLGLMGKDAAGAAPAAAPVGFTDYSRDYGLVQALVDDLRHNRQCHLVIALSHAGINASGTAGEDVDLAQHVHGIDVIAAGHTHNPLGAARQVANGGWTTAIISAGAFGTNVTRVELTYHLATGTTTVTSSDNPAMTDAGLAMIQPGLQADPAFGFLLAATDLGLNAALGGVFGQVPGWADYDPKTVATGLYHVVGTTDQDLVANNKSPVPGPNGLGNLCADAERAVPNLLIAKALSAQGWTGGAADPQLPGLLAKLQAAGFDPHPYEIGLVATGVLRGSLRAGVQLSFADVYNVLPLGASPDATQAMPIGYPLLSTYLTVEDLRKLCAFQLVGQTGLIPVDFYLNLSGLRYSLKAPELYAYFKWATAAGVLTATGERAANGSAAAMAALGALDALGADGGAALQAARLAGNPFVAAMVNLNDFLPDAQGLAANLGVLAQVAAAREPSALGGLLVAKALAAVGDLAGFAPEDAACTGTAASLDGTVRHRLAASLYTLAMMAGVRARFGVELTAYRDATGPAVLDAADLPAAMANRVTLDPAGSAVVETKEWQALLLYLTTPQALGGHFLDGRVTNEYAGAAVWNRAPDYPSEALGRYLATLDLLRTAP